MTRHKHAQTGLVTPQLPQLLLTAALRMLAMLVHIVASTLQMIRRRTRVNATRATPTDLPRAKTDTQSKETNAVQQDSPTSAHPEQRSSAARPSKHERVLTAVSHTPSGSVNSVHAFPAKAGIQTSHQKSAQRAHHLDSRLREMRVETPHTPTLT